MQPGGGLGSLSALCFHMWTFSSWEIMTAHRWARKPTQAHYVARCLRGFRRTQRRHFHDRLAGSVMGHFLSGYHLKESAIECGEKDLSETVRKCQNVKVGAPSCLLPPCLSAFLYSPFHPAINQHMMLRLDIWQMVNTERLQRFSVEL